jgi:hypothetical protein
MWSSVQSAILLTPADPRLTDTMTRRALARSHNPQLHITRVLPRHLLDQHRDPGVDRRASSLAGVSPPRADQAPVPAQQRVRCHQRLIRSGRGSSRARAAITIRSARPASAWGSAAAAPRPPGTAATTRRPSTPPSMPAAPSSQSGGRRSGKASVPSQARDTASASTTTAGNPQVNHLCPVLEPHRVCNA